MNMAQIFIKANNVFTSAVGDLQAKFSSYFFNYISYSVNKTCYVYVTDTQAGNI